MIVTGIAHPPERLSEASNLPSAELIYLAKRVLQVNKATHLITSLAPGWEQALAKAAVELEIPFTVAIPYPGRDASWGREARLLYLNMLTKATEVMQVSDCPKDNAVMEAHCWRVDRSELVLALWDCEFQGDTHQTIDYALQFGKPVDNHWIDWQHLVNLRRRPSAVQVKEQYTGAQVFESKT